jgi:hypothetical protein
MVVPVKKAKTASPKAAAAKKATTAAPKASVKNATTTASKAAVAKKVQCPRCERHNRVVASVSHF